MSDGTEEGGVYFICSHQARLELLLFNELFEGIGVTETDSTVSKGFFGGEKKMKLNKTRFKNGAILKVTIKKPNIIEPPGKMLIKHNFTAELFEEGHCEPDDKKHYWANSDGRENDIIFNNHLRGEKEINTSYTVDLTGTYYFMRHGIGTHNAQSDFGKAYSGSEYDSPLTPEGKSKMQVSGDKLKGVLAEDFKRSKFYCSDLRRTRESLVEFARGLLGPLFYLDITVLPCNHEVAEKHLSREDFFKQNMFIKGTSGRQFGGKDNDILQEGGAKKVLGSVAVPLTGTGAGAAAGTAVAAGAMAALVPGAAIGAAAGAGYAVGKRYSQIDHENKSLLADEVKPCVKKYGELPEDSSSAAKAVAGKKNLSEQNMEICNPIIWEKKNKKGLCGMEFQLDMGLYLMFAVANKDRLGAKKKDYAYMRCIDFNLFELIKIYEKYGIQGEKYSVKKNEYKKLYDFTGIIKRQEEAVKALVASNDPAKAKEVEGAESRLVKIKASFAFDPSYRYPYFDLWTFLKNTSNNIDNPPAVWSQNVNMGDTVNTFTFIKGEICCFADDLLKLRKEVDPQNCAIVAAGNVYLMKPCNMAGQDKELTIRGGSYLYNKRDVKIRSLTNFTDDTKLAATARGVDERNGLVNETTCYTVETDLKEGFPGLRVGKVIACYPPDGGIEGNRAPEIFFKKLKETYEKCLAEAVTEGITDIAIPLLSSATFAGIHKRNLIRIIETALMAVYQKLKDSPGNNINVYLYGYGSGQYGEIRMVGQFLDMLVAQDAIKDNLPVVTEIIIEKEGTNCEKEEQNKMLWGGKICYFTTKAIDTAVTAKLRGVIPGYTGNFQAKPGDNIFFLSKIEDKRVSGLIGARQVSYRFTVAIFPNEGDRRVAVSAGGGGMESQIIPRQTAAHNIRAQSAGITGIRDNGRWNQGIIDSIPGSQKLTINRQEYNVVEDTANGILRWGRFRSGVSAVEYDSDKYALMGAVGAGGRAAGTGGRAAGTGRRAAGTGRGAGRRPAAVAEGTPVSQGAAEWEAKRAKVEALRAEQEAATAAEVAAREVAAREKENRDRREAALRLEAGQEAALRLEAGQEAATAAKARAEREAQAAADAEAAAAAAPPPTDPELDELTAGPDFNPDDFLDNIPNIQADDLGNIPNIQAGGSRQKTKNKNKKKNKKQRKSRSHKKQRKSRTHKKPKRSIRKRNP